MDDLISQSPNPRPKITPLTGDPWSVSQCNGMIRSYNRMVDEIEKLSAWIVKHDGDPREALAG